MYSIKKRRRHAQRPSPPFVSTRILIFYERITGNSLVIEIVAEVDVAELRFAIAGEVEAVTRFMIGQVPEMTYIKVDGLKIVSVLVID